MFISKPKILCRYFVLNFNGHFQFIQEQFFDKFYEYWSNEIDLSDDISFECLLSLDVHFKHVPYFYNILQAEC